MLGGARRLLRARAAERKELERREELTLERRLIAQTVRGGEAAASVVSKRLSRGLSEVRKGNRKEVGKRALCEGRELAVPRCGTSLTINTTKQPKVVTARA